MSLLLFERARARPLEDHLPETSQSEHCMIVANCRKSLQNPVQLERSSVNLFGSVWSEPAGRTGLKNLKG